MQVGRKEIIDGQTDKVIYKNVSHIIYIYVLIFVFCIMTDRPTYQVNYTLNTQWYWE